jgi:hypothetical protein
VSVSQDEGGGLAEREFLFREVGLEKFLDGLDLEGKEVAAKAKLEEKRKKDEKRREKRRESKEAARNELSMNMDDDDADGTSEHSPSSLRKEAEDFEAMFSSEEDSDEEEPVPEAAGQIKVALFRVLASGEIKRGEYSPQFDAHDDESSDSAGRRGNNEADGAEIDHTTSFADPKTLDPKLISTQTVTGIDGPEKPYAVFTFLYRGERESPAIPLR